MNEARKVVVKDSPEIAEEVGADSVLILSEEVDTQETVQEVETDEQSV